MRTKANFKREKTKNQHFKRFKFYGFHFWVCVYNLMTYQYLFYNNSIFTPQIPLPLPSKFIFPIRLERTKQKNTIFFYNNKNILLFCLLLHTSIALLTTYWYLMLSFRASNFTEWMRFMDLKTTKKCVFLLKFPFCFGGLLFDPKFKFLPMKWWRNEKRNDNANNVHRMESFVVQDLRMSCLWQR